MTRLSCSARHGKRPRRYRADPTSGREQNPLGTVFIAASTNETTVSRQFHYDTDRLGVKLAATIDALRLVLHVTP